MTNLTRRDCLAAAFALLAWRPPALFAQTHADSAVESALPSDQIRKLLDERIAARQSLGISVGITERGQRRFVSAGIMAQDDPREITANSVFGIASLTKPLVALLLADAVRRGELQYESVAATYLPGVRLPERNGRKITLLDLATHTAGLPHELPDAEQVAARVRNQEEAKAALFAYVASLELPTEPGAAWSYSNLDYALITWILERCTGKDYATLLRERLTAPLGMHDTVAAMSPELRARRASPHNASLQPAPEWNKPWMGAVLSSTTADLLTFVEANLPSSKHVIAPTLAQMLKLRRPAPALGAEQAIGWYVYNLRGRPMVGHSGAGGGFVSSAVFDPATDSGVVLLSNAEVIQEDLARHILRPSLPLDAAPSSIVLEASELEKYVGDFRDDTGASVRIQRKDTQLWLLMPTGHKAPLTPQSATQFFVRGFAGLTVAFAIDAAGRIDSLTWTLNRKPTVARRL